MKPALFFPNKIIRNSADETYYEEVLEQEVKSIENESFFRAVDRRRAEEILKDRVDGSCLVRPFKEPVNNTLYLLISL